MALPNLLPLSCTAFIIPKERLFVPKTMQLYGIGKLSSLSGMSYYRSGAPAFSGLTTQLVTLIIFLPFLPASTFATLFSPLMYFSATLSRKCNSLAPTWETQGVISAPGRSRLLLEVFLLLDVRKVFLFALGVDCLIAGQNLSLFCRKYRQKSGIVLKF